MSSIFDKASNTQAEFLGPAYDVIPITAGAGDLTDPVDGSTYIARALRCSSDGTATIVTIAGKTRTGVQLFKGDNPIGARKVTAMTVTNMWGLI